MTHELKLLEDFAEPVLNGEKRFEVRENGRGFQKGDTVTFRVVERGSYHMDIFNHPLNGKQFEITYVLSGWGISEGFVAFGFKPKEG